MQREYYESKVKKKSKSESIINRHKKYRMEIHPVFYVGITYLPGKLPCKYCGRE